MADLAGCAIFIASRRLALATEQPAGERYRGGEPFQRSLVSIVGVPLLLAEVISNDAPLALILVASLVGLVIWATSFRVVIVGGVWIDGDDVVIKNAWSHARMRLAECEMTGGVERSHPAADWAFGCEVPRRLVRRSTRRASAVNCFGAVASRTSSSRRLLAAPR